MLILETITGSRLYGFSHDESDHDYYQVVSEGRNKQTIANGYDTTRLNIGSFVGHVAKGVPQAMEALYSPLKWVHSDYAGYIAGLEPNMYELPKTYRRTIRNFVMEDTDKHRRHAMRLAVNLAEWWETGSFNPVISTTRVLDITDLANSERLTIEFINNVSPIAVWDQ